MLNKNDPLIGAVQEVMKKNQAERDAVRLVNEKFGVTDRKALPHERQGEWDAAYKTVLTEGVETLNELSPETLENYKDKRKTQVHATLRNMKDWQLKKTPQGASDFIINSAKKAAKHAKMIKLAGDKIDGKKGVVPANRPKKRLEEEELDEKKIKMYGIPNKVKPKRGPLGPRDINAIRVTNDLFRRMEALKKGNVKAAGNVTKAQIKKMQSEEALDEKLVGNQHRIDANKNGRVDGHDFKLLKKGVRPVSEGEAPKTDPYAEGQASSISTVSQPKKEVTPADQSALKKKIMSIKEAKSNAYAVGMAAVKKSTGDEPPMKKKNIMKAHKIAKKIIAKKKMDEGFNNRHNSSVKASVEEQVVAEIAAYPGTPAGFAASSSSMQAAERQRRMGERRSELIAQRQQGGDVAPKPQPNMTLQRQQSGDVAPRPQSSVALQRQQSGDVAPRPQGQASPMMGQGTSKSSVKPNAPGVDRGRALQAQKSASALGGFGADKTLKAAPTTSTATKSATSKKPISAAPTLKPMRTAGASTKDATLMARAQADGGQKLSQTFKSGGDKLNYLRARAQANK